MKAITYTHYEPLEVLQVKELPKPLPRDNEILIQVRAIIAHVWDVRMRKPGAFLPRLQVKEAK